MSPSETLSFASSAQVDTYCTFAVSLCLEHIATYVHNVVCGECTETVQ